MGTWVGYFALHEHEQRSIVVDFPLQQFLNHSKRMIFGAEKLNHRKLGQSRLLVPFHDQYNFVWVFIHEVGGVECAFLQSVLLLMHNIMTITIP